MAQIRRGEYLKQYPEHADEQMMGLEAFIGLMGMLKKAASCVSPFGCAHMKVAQRAAALLTAIQFSWGICVRCERNIQQAPIHEGWIRAIQSQAIGV